MIETRLVRVSLFIDGAVAAVEQRVTDWPAQKLADHYGSMACREWPLEAVAAVDADKGTAFWFRRGEIDD